MGKLLLCNKRAVDTALLFFIAAFTVLLLLPQICYADANADGETGTDKTVITDFKDFDENDRFTPYCTIYITDNQRNSANSLLPVSLDVKTSDGNLETIHVKWRCGDDIRETEYDRYAYEPEFEKGYMLSDELQEKLDTCEIVLPYVNVQILQEGAYTAAESEYPLPEIRGNWQDMSDDKLNEYIGNNSSSDLYNFLNALSERELELLLKKDTMLRNEAVYEEDGERKSKLYYRYILENEVPEATPMARGPYIDSTGEAASAGYCFIEFKDGDSGYSVTYKLSFTLGTGKDSTTTATKYSMSYAVYKTAGTNSNGCNFAKGDGVVIRVADSYLKQSSTSAESVSDGTEGLNSAGDTIYRTQTYQVFVLNLDWKKPAYTAVPVNPVITDKGDGRYGWREYSWQNTGHSTLDTGVYDSVVTDETVLQINCANTGIATNKNANLTHAKMTVTVQKPVLKLSYNANGGSGSVSAQTVKYNGAFSLRNSGFVKTGYTQSGWNTASDGKGAGFEIGKTVNPYSVKAFTDGKRFTEETMTLYSQWKANTWNVRYSGNGATSGSMSDSEHTYDTAENLTANTYKRRGYKFDGWNTEADGSGTGYSNEQSVKNLTAANGGVIDLYAQWEENTYALPVLEIDDSRVYEADESAVLNITQKMNTLGENLDDVYDSMIIKMVIPEGLLYESVKVTDEKGEDITGCGSFAYDESKREICFEFGSQWLSDEEKYKGQEVKMQISTSILNPDKETETIEVSAQSVIMGKALNTETKTITAAKKAEVLPEDETEELQIEPDEPETEELQTESDMSEPDMSMGETVQNESDDEVVQEVTESDSSADTSENTLNTEAYEEKTSVDTADTFDMRMFMFCGLSALCTAGTLIRKRCLKED